MPHADLLKPREVEILRLIADGMSDRDIAARLNLAAETVRWYNKEIYGKLGVRSRTQAARRAAALGVLDLPVGAPAAGDRVPAAAKDGPGSRTGAPPIVRSPIQYAERGGVYIAWQTIGSGPVDVLLFHGFISHLEIGWENAEYAAFFEQLGRVARVILFDKRGVGLSDRIKGAPALEETVGDAIAVLDAAHSTRAFVMGTSEGGAAALLLSMQHPERARGLILIGATPKVARDGDEPAWAAPRAAFEARIDAIQKTWGQPWSLERFAPSRMHDEGFQAWWSRILRGASSPA
ncbi:MAG TPA: alpha/beta fold hydrolase, partial [Gemmatimonadaceae bacterium]|nr:alpha/beta fold hydrolase [Gemmatimonadaceae bacterium]